MAEPELDPTLIAMRSILASPTLLHQFALQLTDFAGDRPTSSEDAPSRLAATAKELATDRVLRTVLRAHAPGLEALALLGLLDSVEWDRVATAITHAVRPKSCFALSRRGR